MQFCELKGGTSINGLGKIFGHWNHPIQKKSTGFYHLIEFTNDGSIITDFEIAFKRDERILRFLTVKLDKHAVAYNEKKRKRAKAEKEAAK